MMFKITNISLNVFLSFLLLFPQGYLHTFSVAAAQQTQTHTTEVGEVSEDVKVENVETGPKPEAGPVVEIIEAPDVKKEVKEVEEVPDVKKEVIEVANDVIETPEEKTITEEPAKEEEIDTKLEVETSKDINNETKPKQPFITEELKIKLPLKINKLDIPNLNNESKDQEGQSSDPTLEQGENQQPANAEITFPQDTFTLINEAAPYIGHRATRYHDQYAGGNLINGGIGYINDSERGSRNPLVGVLPVAGKAFTFAFKKNVSGNTSPINCNDNSLSYSSSVPTARSLTSDGLYWVCAKIVGNGDVGYSTPLRVFRDILPPTWAFGNTAPLISGTTVSFISRDDGQAFRNDSIYDSNASGNKGYILQTILQPRSRVCTAYDTLGALFSSASKTASNRDLDTLSSRAIPLTPVDANIKRDGNRQGRRYRYCVTIFDAAGNRLSAAHPDFPPVVDSAPSFEREPKLIGAGAEGRLEGLGTVQFPAGYINAAEVNAANTGNATPIVDGGELFTTPVSTIEYKIISQVDEPTCISDTSGYSQAVPTAASIVTEGQNWICSRANNGIAPHDYVDEALSVFRDVERPSAWWTRRLSNGHSTGFLADNSFGEDRRSHTRNISQSDRTTVGSGIYGVFSSNGHVDQRNCLAGNVNVSSSFNTKTYSEAEGIKRITFGFGSDRTDCGGATDRAGNVTFFGYNTPVSVLYTQCGESLTSCKPDAVKKIPAGFVSDELPLTSRVTDHIINRADANFRSDKIFEELNTPSIVVGEDITFKYYSKKLTNNNSNLPNCSTVVYGLYGETVPTIGVLDDRRDGTYYICVRISNQTEEGKQTASINIPSRIVVDKLNPYINISGDEHTLTYEDRKTSGTSINTNNAGTIRVTIGSGVKSLTSKDVQRVGVNCDRNAGGYDDAIFSTGDDEEDTVGAHTYNIRSIDDDKVRCYKLEDKAGQVSYASTPAFIESRLSRGIEFANSTKGGLTGIGRGIVTKAQSGRNETFIRPPSVETIDEDYAIENDNVSYYVSKNAVSTCTRNLRYEIEHTPRQNDLTSDGTWYICAEVSAPGHTFYTNVLTLFRDTIAPSATAILREDNDGGRSDIEISVTDGGNNGSKLISLSSSVHRSTLSGNGSFLCSIAGSALTHSGKGDLAAQGISFSRADNVSTFNSNSAGYNANHYKIVNKNRNILCLRIQDYAGNISWIGFGTYFTSVQVEDEEGNISYVTGAPKINDNYKFITSSKSRDTLPIVIDPVLSTDKVVQLASDSVSYNYAFKKRVANAETLNCKTGNNLSYSSTNPTASSLSNGDGYYDVCVKTTGTDVGGRGVTVFSGPLEVLRDTTPLIFTTPSRLINDAIGGNINASDNTNNRPIISAPLTSGTTSATISYAFKKDVAVPVCETDSAFIYGDTIPTLTDLDSDGAWYICIRAKNIAYTIYSQLKIQRKIALPTLAGFELAGVATDGILNIADQRPGDASIVTAPTGTGTIRYAFKIGSLASCNDDSLSYRNKIITVDSLDIEGAWSLCAFIRDGLGNTAYADPLTLTVDTTAPTFTAEPPLAGAADDGYINDSEKALVTAIVTAPTASEAPTTLTYAVKKSNSDITCNASIGAYIAAPPTPAALLADGIWYVCAKLIDAAQNEGYSDAIKITRDTTLPQITRIDDVTTTPKPFHLVKAIIRDQNAGLSRYWVVRRDSGACEDGDFTGLGTAPENEKGRNETTRMEIGTNGQKFCFKARDLAGNETILGSDGARVPPTITTQPAIVSALVTTVGSNYYINNSQKTSTAALITAPEVTQSPTLKYLVVKQDTLASCTASTGTYTSTTIPTVASINAEGTHFICTEVTNTGGTIFTDKIKVTRDTSVPVLSAPSSIGTVITSTPTFTFTSSEVATISYGGSCSSDTTTSSNASNSVVFNALDNGVYSDCTLTVTDAAGNVSNVLAVSEFTIATEEPVITTEPTPTNVLTNASGENYIISANRDSTDAVINPAVSSADGVLTYSYVKQNILATCTASTGTYIEARPTAAEFNGGDGIYFICAKALNDYGEDYSRPFKITRITILPTFSTLPSHTGVVVDRYLNNEEKDSGGPVITAATTEAVGATITYSVASGNNVSACSAFDGKIYTVGIPTTTTLDSDGAWYICAKVSNVAGDNFSSSVKIDRDTSLPNITFFGDLQTSAPSHSVSGSIFDNGSGLARYWTKTKNTGTCGIGDFTGLGTPASGIGSFNGIRTPETILNINQQKLCVRVRDVAGNENIAGSSEARVPPVISTQPSIVSTEITKIGTEYYINNAQKNGTSPLISTPVALDATFTYSIVATSSSGSCIAASGIYTDRILRPIDITSDSAYKICAKATNSGGDAFSTPIKITRDTTLPIITSSGDIGTTDTSTPTFIFESTEAGAITYGGSCSSVTTEAVDGSNSVVFNALASGTYEDCTLTVTDRPGNISLVLQVESFIVATIAAVITTEPTRTSIVSVIATENYIIRSDRDSTLPIISPAVTSDGVLTYSLVKQDTLATCTASTGVYTANIPTVVNLDQGEGIYFICAKAENDHGEDYSTPFKITKATVLPSISRQSAIVSAEVTTVGGAYYINDAQQRGTNALITAAEASGATITYEAKKSDTNISTCSAGTYLPDIPTAVTLNSDGNWYICAKASNVAGDDFTNTPIKINRDTSSPNISFHGDQQTSTASHSVRAEIYDNGSGLARYWIKTKNTGTCEIADFTGLEIATSGIGFTNGRTIPVTILNVNEQKLCLRVQDIAGNELIAGSSEVRVPPVISTQPTVTSHYINNAQKNGTNALIGTPIASESGVPTYSFVKQNTLGACIASTGTYISSIPTARQLASDGVYYICARATNSGGDAFTTPIKITRDTTLPILSSPEAIGTSITATPTFTFTSSEAGAITYGGSCSSVKTETIEGRDQVVFNALASGTYTNCTLTVTDAAGNVSLPLSVQRFIVNTPSTSITTQPTPTTIVSVIATENYIIRANRNSARPIITPAVASESGVLTYSFVKRNTLGACTASTGTYTGTIPIASQLTSDGVYYICARAVNDDGEDYSRPFKITRVTALPSISRQSAIVSAEVTTVNNKYYINNAQQGGTNALITAATASGATITYEAKKSDTNISTCSAGRYVATRPTAATLNSDGNWYICAKASNIAGDDFTNTPIKISRDTAGPVIGSFTNVRTSAASHSVSTTIRDQGSGLIKYWTTTKNTGTCAIADFTGSEIRRTGRSLFTLPVTTITRNEQKLCVRAQDVAGNESIGGSSEARVLPVINAQPTVVLAEVTTLNGAYYINDAQKNGTSPLISTPVVVRSPEVEYSFVKHPVLPACNDSIGIYRTAIPTATTLVSEGIHFICVKVSNSAGDVFTTPIKITKDTRPPTLSAPSNIGTATTPTPTFTFTSNESGAITYGGRCSSVTTEAVNGSNSIVFNTLENRVYGNCTVTVTDILGNVSDVLGVRSFTVSTPVAEITTEPTRTSIVTPDSGNNYINNTNKNSNSAIINPPATSGGGALTYSFVKQNTLGACIVSTGTYTGTIPTARQLTSDGIYYVCAKTKNDYGEDYSRPFKITRVTALPSITKQLTLTGTETSDIIINNAEKTLGNPIIEIPGATNSGTITYTVKKSTSSITCDASTGTYATARPTAATLNSDGNWYICAKASNIAGDDFSTSRRIVRDTEGPIIRDFTDVGTPAKSHSVSATIRDELSSLNKYWTVVKTGSCNSAVFTGSGISKIAITDFVTIPPTIITTNEEKLCVKATDLAGNERIAGSSAVRVPPVISTQPTFFRERVTTIGTEYYINNAQKNGIANLIDLPLAPGATRFAYLLVKQNTLATCTTSTGTYGNIIPKPTTLATDGTYFICVRANSSGGNVFTKPLKITRDTVAPVLSGSSSVGAVDTPSPTFTFTSSEVGVITYGGGCSSDTTDAVSGSNSIIFNSLANGTYGACTLTVTDVAGTASNVFPVPSFTVDTPIAAITTQPTRTNIVTFVGGENYINRANSSIRRPIINAPVTSGGGTLTYSFVKQDTLVACTASTGTYTGTIPTARDLGSDGVYFICAEASNSYGQDYSRPFKITKITSVPTFSARPRRATVISDLYLNKVEQSSGVPVISTATTNTTGATITYEAKKSAVSITICGAGNYVVTVPTTATINSDGDWYICAKASNVAGDVFSQPIKIIRDISVPNIGGFTDVTSTPKASHLASASIHDIGTGLVRYWTATKNTGTCGIGDFTGQGTPISGKGLSGAKRTAETTLNINGQKLCVRVRDVAGNENILGSEGARVPPVISTQPSIVSAEVTTIGTEYYINDTQQSGTRSLIGTPVASGATFTYSIVDANTLNACTTSTGTYGTRIPRATDISSQGIHFICAKATNLGGDAFTTPIKITKDTIAPILASPLTIGTAGTPTPTFIFTSTEAGTVTYGGSCSSTTTTITSGSNSVVFNSLANGTYTNCNLSVTDAVGNTSGQLGVPRFIIDTPIPVITTEPTPTSVVTVDSGTNYINNTNRASTSAIINLPIASGGGTLTYSLVRQDSLNACTASTGTYSARVPRPSDLRADGVYFICAKASNDFGQGYSTPFKITRITAVPRITSFPRIVSTEVTTFANQYYINDNQKGSTNALITAPVSSGSESTYSLVKQDVLNTCSASTGTYTGTIPTVATLTENAAYFICTKTSNIAGDVFTSPIKVTRDIGSPTIAITPVDLSVEKISHELTIQLDDVDSELRSYRTALKTAAGNCVAADFQGVNQILISGSSQAVTKSIGVHQASLCVEVLDRAGNSSISKSSQASVSFEKIAGISTPSVYIDRTTSSISASVCHNLEARQYTIVSVNENIARVSASATTGSFTITGVSAGVANIDVDIVDLHDRTLSCAFSVNVTKKRRSGGGGIPGFSPIASSPSPSSSAGGFAGLAPSFIDQIIPSLNVNKFAGLSSFAPTQNAPQPSVVNFPTTPQKVSITRSVREGNRGSDIKSLQQFLNEKGFVVSETGPGSVGQETEYFGPATKQALESFQKENGLEQTGILDESTKEVVNQEAEIETKNVIKTLVANLATLKANLDRLLRSVTSSNEGRQPAPVFRSETPSKKETFSYTPVPTNVQPNLNVDNINQNEKGIDRSVYFFAPSL